jgi:uncharacterized membrane protein YfcA
MIEFPLTITETLVFIPVITVACLVQSTVGFGLGLVAAPILLLINPAFVPVPLLFCSLMLSVLVLFHNRESLDIFGLKVALVGRIPGTIVGVFVLALLPTNTLSIVLAGIIILSVGLSLIGNTFKPRGFNLFSAGILSGFMATTASLGGPPIALVYQHASARTIRSTMAGYFIIGIILSLIALFIGGQLGISDILIFFVALPGVLIGFLLSLKMTKCLNQKIMRPLILSFSSLAAISVIIKIMLFEI